MPGKKFDFSKLKNLGSLDIKDIKNLFSGENSSNKASSSKFNAKNILNTKIERTKIVAVLDIGSNSIKIVEGKCLKGKVVINNCFTVPTPEGAVLDGRITDEAKLRDTIKLAIKENGIKAKDVTCTTNSSLIINRELIIPKVKAKEMDTVVRYEVQQYLPIRLEEYIIQVIVLEEVKIDEDVKLKVNVIAYPEKIASSYYSLVNSLELNPYILDVNLSSISKMANHLEFNNSNDSLEGTIAFIDMGSATTDITIFKNGKLDFTRRIKGGGEEIDQALSRKLNLSIKSTQVIKIEKGNLNNINENDEINLTIKKIVDNILDELETIIQFYNTIALGNRINKIVIYGGASNIKALDNYIQDRLNITTEKVVDLKNIEFTSKEIKEQAMHTYVNAIGAIIRL